MSVDTATSIGLGGRTYVVPDAAERDRIFVELERQAKAARGAGREVVVVQGLGFVGSVMAAVLANATDDSGAPRFLVIGVDLPTTATYWKVGMINDGLAPVVADDPRVAAYVDRAVSATGNLTACADDRVYELADVVVVDVQIDVDLESTADLPEVDLGPFETAIRTIGRSMGAETLVVIETTVPPGTTSRVALPALREELARRGIDAEPLVAQSYERVMPGRNYVQSIEQFWRVFATESDAAATRAHDFLSSFIDTERFPLTRLRSPVEAELGKVLENSYRAANIAFIQEWTAAAESVGVDLNGVIDAIAKRAGTHDNIRRPGFGVGGYCLPKDGFLAQWGLRELLDCDTRLDHTLQALRTNDTMPLHTLSRLRDAIGGLDGRSVLVAGVSYLADVADTRNSPAAVFCDAVSVEGGSVSVHDPRVDQWPERPEVPFVELDEGLGTADALVFAVRHGEYLTIGAQRLIAAAKPGLVIVDAADVVSDQDAETLRDAGLIVVGIGKGHWKPGGGAE